MQIQACCRGRRRSRCDERAGVRTRLVDMGVDGLGPSWPVWVRWMFALDDFGDGSEATEHDRKRPLDRPKGAVGRLVMNLAGKASHVTHAG